MCTRMYLGTGTAALCISHLAEPFRIHVDFSYIYIVILSYNFYYNQPASKKYATDSEWSVILSNTVIRNIVKSSLS